MRRREFVTLFTGAAIFGSCAAVAQTSSKVCRLGTLTPGLPRAGIPLSANRCHMRRSNWYRYSITSSARASNSGGTVRPRFV